MTSLTAVTSPMFRELEGAIGLLDKQRAEAIDEIQATLAAAQQARADGLKAVSAMRAEAMRKEVLIEDAYSTALASIRAALSEIRPADGQRLKAAQ